MVLVVVGVDVCGDVEWCKGGGDSGGSGEEPG